MNDQELFEALEQAHKRNRLESTFAETLEARLRAAHPRNRGRRWPVVYRGAAAAAAATVLLVVAFTTVPTLRAFAQEVLNFFTPAETNVISLYDTEPPMYLYSYRPQPSLEAADERVEFPFLVLPDATDGSGGLIHLFADHDAILLVYQTGPAALDQIPPIIAIRQLHTPSERLRPMIVPGIGTTYEDVTVRGFPAVYATGGWSLQTPLHSDGEAGVRYQQLGARAHRLAWWEDDVAIILTLSETVTDSLDDVIAIANRLQRYDGPEASGG